MGIQLTKTHHGRTRFLKGKALEHPLDWHAVLYSLKQEVNSSTLLQIVGDKTIFAVQENVIYPLLEVIGTPVAVDRFALELFDLNERDAYIRKIAADFSETSFDALLLEAQKIKLSLKTNAPFHIVIFNGKIELHFFLQNDYSQNLL